MKQKAVLIITICGLVLSLAGCDKISNLNPISRNKGLSVQGVIVAKVNDTPITLEQLDQEIQNYNELMDNPELKITTTEQKLSYLNDELVRRYLVYQEAKTRGLDKQAKIKELLRNLEVNVLANQLIQEEIDNIVVTSSEVEDFYNLYKDQYKQIEERKIREILVDAENTARDVLVELLRGADFDALARQYSRAQSASSGGDLGFIKKGQRGADFSQFDDVAFSPSLTAGQLSSIFKGKGGYYILKVQEIRGGQLRTLSDVWDEIKKNLTFLKQQQKLQELINKISKDADIVVYKEKIK
ncbi:MAG: peptidylprolyl isomerase [Candidatus Omnitrophota bacterium]